MKRLAVLLLICLWWLPHALCGGDFILRLEEVGYDRTTDGEEMDEDDDSEPVPQVRSTLKMLIRPGERFSSTAEVGACKLSIRGRCKCGERRDQLILEVAGGSTIVTGARATFRTMFTAKVGQPHGLGGTASKGEQNFNGAVRSVKSASKLILTITEEDWNHDDAEEDDAVAENAPVAIYESDLGDEKYYRRMFPNGNGTFATPIALRMQHDRRLPWKIAVVDRVCELTSTQKEKLQLAGRGDIKRLFDLVEEIGWQFQLVNDDQQAVDTLLQKNEPLRRSVCRHGLASDDALFFKTLEKLLTAEQRAKYEPLRQVICSGGEVEVRKSGSNEVFKIKLTGTTFADEGLARLHELRDVQILNLDGTKVTDAGLPQLNGMTSLRSLSLANTKLTDAGLAQLAGLTSVKTLVLDKTAITDVGLVHLKAMSRLSYLSLEKTDVTDAGLLQLSQITSLRSLRLSGTRVTDARIAELKRDLPDLEIHR